MPLTELFAHLLSTILQSEINASEQARLAERAKMEAMIDSLSGLYNRRGWDRLLATEAARCQRYGHSACFMSIDIDYLKCVNDLLGHSEGDELIRRMSEAIKSTVRAQDIAARLGGDEFAILAVQGERSGYEEVLTRLRTAIAQRGIQASIGMAICQPGVPFEQTWNLADRAMYCEKRGKRASRSKIAGVPTNDTGQLGVAAAPPPA